MYRGLFFVQEYCGEVVGFSPLYAAETEQSSAEAGTSERNMEFIRRTMLSAKVQDVVANLAGQNLLVATNRRDPQNLQPHSRALRTALAWGMGHLGHIGQRVDGPAC
jgi:hypothetical protein